MSPVALTGLARFPLLLLQQAESLGLDRAELMTTAGVTENDLSDPDARIPLLKTWNLWRIVIDRVQDPMVGLHLGASLKIRDLGLVGYAMYYSQDLNHGLHRMARYVHILSEAVQFDVKSDERQAWVHLEHSPRFAALRHPVDATLAAALTAAREMTGVDIAPVEVRFPHPAPAATSEYQRFFRAPLRYEQPKAMLVLHRADLDLPVVAADETLGNYLDKLADETLKTLSNRGTFSDGVRRAVWVELSEGPPSLKRTASSLGVSVRTLQRRLRAESTTFAEVVEEMRRHIARKLLRDRNLAVYEIAFLLGYSEPSTFYRAFRRWENTSPHEYRRSIA